MGTTERRKREALQRRKSILAAARKVFWEKGYAGTTVAQLAAKAELAPGTLYLYFSGKDAIYVELLTEGYELLVQRLQAATSQGDPRTAAGALIDAFFGFARETPEYFEIIFFVLQRENAGTWEDNFPPEQAERLRRWRSACTQAAAGILGQVNFGSSQRRDAIVEAIWGMLSGVVFHFRNRDVFDAVAGEAKTLLLAAIFGREGLL